MQSNVEAYTHAVGWSGLFNGFAGKDGKRITPQELLPYPQESTGESKRTISRRTAEIFLRLKQQGKLPRKIISATSLLWEEIEELIRNS